MYTSQGIGPTEEKWVNHGIAGTHAPEQEQVAFDAEKEAQRARAIAGPEPEPVHEIDYGLPIVATAIRPHPLLKDHPGVRVSGLVYGFNTYAFDTTGGQVLGDAPLVRISTEQYEATFKGAHGLQQRNVDLTAKGRREMKRADKVWRDAHR
jgi:hypothetical protein